MPITETILPYDQMELNKKILATKPGEENIILDDVQTHLKKKGYAVYQQSEDEIIDVELRSAKCTVFLIGGEFKVGDEDVAGQGEGYLVENEKTIQLQKYTVVVIIDEN